MFSVSFYKGNDADKISTDMKIRVEEFYALILEVR